MTQMNGMASIHPRPTKNPSQGAEPTAITCKETSAPTASPYALRWGGQSWKHSKTFFASALTGEDPEQKALGSTRDTWEQPVFPAGWSPLSCWLFLWHIFLKCSHSGHLMLCCKEAGQPFHNPAIFIRCSRATMVKKKVNARDLCE